MTSILTTKRVRWMISTISESLGIKKESTVEVSHDFLLNLTKNINILGIFKTRA